MFCLRPILRLRPKIVFLQSKSSAEGRRAKFDLRLNTALKTWGPPFNFKTKLRLLKLFNKKHEPLGRRSGPGRVRDLVDHVCGDGEQRALEGGRREHDEPQEEPQEAYFILDALLEDNNT